ncbi:DUF4156 domain-containing protein [Methyloprofundus sp.]|uniref:DUF4156 domain-containing protein n=1 Tax=Methyloprofundus sp. TaxID=2020875 RepID=UPI003D12B0B3
MIIKPVLPITLMLVTVISCAISLQEGAEIVELIYIKPNDDSCRFIGQTSASDGGMVSGDFMTDAKIYRSTANLMKNKAYDMGGNVVYIQQQFNKNATLTKTLTNQTMIGFVYQCQVPRYSNEEIHGERL